MPKFHVTSPDGRTIEVDAPEGATEDQAIKYAQDNWETLSKGAVSEQAQPQLGVSQDIAQQIPGTPPQGIPQEEPSWQEKARAAAQAAGGTISSAIGGVPALAYGVGRDIYERTLGEGKAGVSEAPKYAEEALKYVPFQPTSELGKEYQAKIGEAASALPPVIPEAGMLRPAAQAVGLEAQRFGAIPKVASEIPEVAKKQQVFAEGRKYGYVATPTAVADTAIGATAESISNKAKITAETSIKNSESRANDIRVNDLGLPEGKSISSGELEQIRNDIQKKTESIVKEVPQLTTTPELRTDLEKVVNKYKYVKENFPDVAKGGTIPTQEAMGLIRYLRQKADEKLSAPVGAKISPENKAEGEFSYRLAKKIEDNVGEHLLDKPELLKEFQDARRKTAQTYAIQAAMNPATGDISGLKLAAAYRKNPEIFTGGLKRAAEHALAFPADNRDLARIGGHPPLSAWDFLVAGGTAAAGHPLVAASEIAARGLLPKLAVSDLVQNRLVKNPKFNNWTIKQMDHPTMLELKRGAAKEAADSKKEALDASNLYGARAGISRGEAMVTEAQVRAKAKQAAQAAETNALMKAGELRGQEMIIDAQSREAAKNLAKRTEQDYLQRSGISRGEAMTAEAQRARRKQERTNK